MRHLKITKYNVLFFFNIKEENNYHNYGFAIADFECFSPEKVFPGEAI